MVEEGWYTDPQDAARLRYWDGAGWTEHTHDRPDDEAEAEQPPDEEPSPAEKTTRVEQDLAEPTRPAAPAEPAPTAPATLRWSTKLRQSTDPAPPRDPAPIPRRRQPAPSPRPASPAPPDPIPQPAAPAATYVPTAQVEPPVEPAPEPDPDLGRSTARPGHLNDIGQWLGRTFRVGLANLVPCGALLAFGLVPAVFFYAVAYLALSEVVGDDGVQGTTVAMVLVLGLLFLMWMLWVGVVTLAQNHLLYHAHIGSRTSIGRSMQAGFQGVGRLAWAYLTLVAYVVMVVAVVGGLTVAFSLVSDTLGGVFFVVAYLAALTLTVWLGVKLSFLVVAAAVAPPGERPMVVSVETTNGYFWAVLGRLLLLGLVLSAALVPMMLILGVVFGASGTSFVNDPGSGTATALIGTVAVGGVLYLLVTLAMQVFSTSGIVRLYVDLGGPAQAPESESTG